MRVIAFTGMPFSGKTEAVNAIKSKGVPVIRMGDFVWDEVQQRGLPVTERNVGRIAQEMRKKHGMAVWAKKTLVAVKRLGDNDLVVIDGIRNPEEVTTFKEALGNKFTLIAITAPDSLRHQRALCRGRADDSNEIEQVKQRDQRELEWGMEKVIALADMIIDNQGSLDELRRKIGQLVRPLIKGEKGLKELED
jgi:dephospho-CoA kinase